jgi:hypothetical protein
LPLRIAEFLSKFFESEMHNVVLVDLFWSDIIAKLKPIAVQQINLLESEMQGVRPQIEDLFLAGGRVNNKSQLQFGIGQPLPREPSDASFFGERPVRGGTQHHYR